MEMQTLSHTRWKCQYHIVFIPKYRQKRLFGKVKRDLLEILRKLCAYKKVEIVNGAICSDHVHMNIKVPPKLSISELVISRVKVH
jgi:putative transposase